LLLAYSGGCADIEFGLQVQRGAWHAVHALLQVMVG
jgi:hypothetical protein